MRIAAIRRHGRRPATPRWRWFVAQSGLGGEALYAGEASDPRDYLDLALDGSDGTTSTDPLVAVCAHGKHDQCCAVRGRGATAAIADRYPEITWECSHLGGDRFAATMLVLPEGLCYGRVDPTDSAELVRLYLDGRLDNRFLRGRTSLPHAVQAAQYFARLRSGDDRIASLPPLNVEIAMAQCMSCSRATLGRSKSASTRSSPSRCCRSARPACLARSGSTPWHPSPRRLETRRFSNSDRASRARTPRGSGQL